MRRYNFKKFLCLGIGIWLLGGVLSAQQPASTPCNGWPKADKRFYFDLQGGYGFRMGSGYTGFLRFDEEDKYTGDPHIMYSPSFGKAIKKTLGAGWQGSLNFGYHFNRYMAIEVGLGYTQSGFSASQCFISDTSGYIFMSNDIYHVDPSFSELDDYWTPIEISNDFNSHIGNLHVALRLSPGFQRWDPYLKMGVNLMVGVVNHDIRAELGELHYTWDSYYTTINYDWGGFGRSGQERLTTTAVGFTAAFGINCRFTPTISMFAEWQFTLMSSVAYRDHWVNVDNAYGNEAYSPVLDKAIVQKSFDGHTAVRSDFVLPFSNTGLNIGLKFAF